MQKNVFVESIDKDTPGFIDVFLVAAASIRDTKKGGSYLNLTLRDKTGSIEARMWDWKPELTIPEVDSFLKVEAVPQEYRDEVQLKITKQRMVGDTEVEIEDFLPVSKYDRYVMFGEVLMVAGEIRNERLKTFLLSILQKHSERLMDAPAAKGNHQPYLGGLLEHILNLTKLAQLISPIYELDTDLIVTAAVVHDIGKIDELSYGRSINYTRRGSLTGHVVMGIVFLHNEWIGERDETFDHLEHIIASHHGNKEWGAAQVPMSREAWMFHLLDMIDSRMGLFETMATAAVDKDGFTEFNRSLGSRAYMPARRTTTIESKNDLPAAA